MTNKAFTPRVTCLCGTDVEAHDVGDHHFEGDCPNCKRHLTYVVRTELRLTELKPKPQRAGKK